jgi:hypothetical protein
MLLVLRPMRLRRGPLRDRLPPFRDLFRPFTPCFCLVRQLLRPYVEFLFVTPSSPAVAPMFPAAPCPRSVNAGIFLTVPSIVSAGA